MMENLKVMKGRDVSAPVQHVVYNGERYPMVFNNRAARITEDVYAEHYGRDIGYYGVLAEVAIPKHRAIMAVVYASIVAGGAAVSWEEFEENFSLADVEGVTEAIRRGTLESLPDEDPEGGDASKNAATAPTEA